MAPNSFGEQGPTCSGVDQSSISQFERGEIGVMSVDTLRKYVEALGGHLRITAEFEDSEIPVA